MLTTGTPASSPERRKAPQLRGLRPGHVGLLCGQSREGNTVLALRAVRKPRNQKLLAAQEGRDVEVAGARLELGRPLARHRRGRLERRAHAPPPLGAEA